MNIFLDTTIFSASPRRDNAAFNTLVRLVETNSASLHVSSVTQREFTTQQEVHFNNSTTEIRNALRAIRRRLPDGDPSLADLAAVDVLIAPLEERLRRSANDSFAEWLKQGRVSVHPPKEDHASRVLDSYFLGAPPFKTIKKRDDFPDAFIFAALSDHAAASGDVHAIIVDAQLRAAAAALPGVATYATLDEFVRSDVCQTIILEDNTSRNIARIAERLRADQSFLDAILNEVIPDTMVGQEITPPEVPEEDSTARVSGVYAPTHLGYEFDKLEYYGGGIIIVPFMASVPVLADYYVAKGDYHTLDDARAARMAVSDWDWNDYYIAVEEHFLLLVSGTLSVSFDEEILSDASLSDSAIHAAISDMAGALDEYLDVEVQLPDAM